MSQVTEKLMTAEEFAEWVERPENRDRLFELERGRVIEVPRPSELHCSICWVISLILGNHLYSRGQGYLLTNDSGLVVGKDPDTVRGPDIMFINEKKRAEQMSRKWTSHTPQLIIEVLSPNDRMNKTTARIGQYLDHGVPVVWLVDPEVRSVAVYRPEQFPQVLDNSDELTGGDVLPDFRCKVSDLFKMPGE